MDEWRVTCIEGRRALRILLQRRIIPFLLTYNYILLLVYLLLLLTYIAPSTSTLIPRPLLFLLPTLTFFSSNFPFLFFPTSLLPPSLPPLHRTERADGRITKLILTSHWPALTIYIYECVEVRRRVLTFVGLVVPEPSITHHAYRCHGTLPFPGVCRHFCVYSNEGIHACTILNHNLLY